MTPEMTLIDDPIKKSDGRKRIDRRYHRIDGEFTQIPLKSNALCDILKNTFEIIVQNVESEVPMDDSKLRALLTAVQCGSFGKAAVQLGYTQSAMTHLVSKLEAELGCTLLLRSSKGVCLSEEGEHLLPYIHGVINACDALRQEAEEQGEVYGRALRIGCFASIARASLPELLRMFRKLHPEIKVDVLVQGSELAAALEEDRIQLAIVDENCARGFQWTPLTDAPLVAVTPKDFPWTEQGRAYIAGVEELGVTYLGCFLHRAYFRWVDDGRPEEMFSDLVSQAQEARCVRSAQIFAAALCALGAAMQFYTTWAYLHAAQIYEELYAELIAAGGPSVVAAWMPRITLETVLGLSWLALAAWGASAAVRTHKKWKKIKDEQCICE